MESRWVVCRKGRGHLHEKGKPEHGVRMFPVDSVGLVQEHDGKIAVVWLIGRNETWSVPVAEIAYINILKTGDKHPYKVCNRCHCLLPVGQFSKNQTNLHGRVRRPTCLKCRTDIDKRAPKSSQARRMEKNRPQKGEPFKCPICQKRSIVGITAKVVADHDHHTGNIRDFICDSCNTGLGRFKNGEDILGNAISYLRERDSLGTSEEGKSDA